LGPGPPNPWWGGKPAPGGGAAAKRFPVSAAGRFTLTGPSACGRKGDGAGFSVVGYWGRKKLTGGSSEGSESYPGKPALEKKPRTSGVFCRLRDSPCFLFGGPGAAGTGPANPPEGGLPPGGVARTAEPRPAFVTGRERPGGGPAESGAGPGRTLPLRGTFTPAPGATGFPTGAGPVVVGPGGTPFCGAKTDGSLNGSLGLRGAPRASTGEGREMGAVPPGPPRPRATNSRHVLGAAGNNCARYPWTEGPGPPPKNTLGWVGLGGGALAL